jgi:DNA repair protein RadA/Sms
VQAGSEPARPAREAETGGKPAATVDLSQVGSPGPRLPTGVGEVDRALSGGFVSGATVLLGGEPGVGKSTLALQLARRFAKMNRKALYVAGEESLDQVALRLKRLGGPLPNLRFLAETDAATVAATLASERPAFAVVDSVQTLKDPEVRGAAGTPAQVRASAGRIAATARATGIPVLLVGQVTKTGAFAGPKAFEHAVDVVLMLEGDPTHALRVLTAAKNRFGSTDEVGVFDLKESGFVPVPDPSKVLTEHRSRGAGSVVTPVTAGSRVFLVELQALTVPAALGAPKRTASGFDAKRLAVLLAVLERRAGIRCAAHDVYVNAAGGVRVDDPAADLAVCLAVASARLDRLLPPNLTAVGEVGLSGEVRAVARLEGRLKEARRLGFVRALTPKTRGRLPNGVTPVRTVAEALAAAGLATSDQG